MSKRGQIIDSWSEHAAGYCVKQKGAQIHCFSFIKFVSLLGEENSVEHTWEILLKLNNIVLRKKDCLKQFFL